MISEIVAGYKFIGYDVFEANSVLFEFALAKKTNPSTSDKSVRFTESVVVKGIGRVWSNIDIKGV